MGISRKKIRELAQDQILELKARDVAFWKSQELPWSFQVIVEGYFLEFEVSLLEEGVDFQDIAIAVSAEKNWLSSYLPVCFRLCVEF